MGKQIRRRDIHGAKPRFKRHIKRLTLGAVAISSLAGVVVPTAVVAQDVESQIGVHLMSYKEHLYDGTVEEWLFKGVNILLDLLQSYLERNNLTIEQFRKMTLSELNEIEPLKLGSLANEIKKHQERENISPIPIVEEYINKLEQTPTKPKEVVVEEKVVNISPIDVIEEPIIETPVEDEPIIETPVEDEPIVETPVEDEPIIETPVEDEPIIETPVEDEPIIETPVEDEPIVETPVVDEPIIETPVEDEPIIETPVDEPIVETPVEDEPIIETPVVEEPNIETPVVDEPIIETPVSGNGIKMRVQATMYSQHQEGLSNWTAGGYNLNENPNIIAVNPEVIPYGSVVVIDGVGTYIAGDTGSYVTWGGDYTTGIDIHTNDLSEAYAFGKKFVDITVYPAGTDFNTPVVEEPVIEEPVYEEPVVEEPVIEEPVYEEPVVEEPVIEEPVVEEPVIEEPVIEEPVYEEPVVEEPVIEEPVYEEPVVEEPVIEEPVYEEPVVEEPVYEEPVYEEPVYEEPVYEEPVYEEPVYEEPVYEEPVYNGGGLIGNAEKYIGTPYVWGGKTPSGFDCSGFVYYVFMETYGMDLGSWTGSQQYAGQLISVEEAQAGDLYFWGTYGGDTTHVAIATGGGSYIHASQPGSPLGYGSIYGYAPQFAIRVL